jgi:predicted lipid-binding transport protein (Tim44 family)
VLTLLVLLLARLALLSTLVLLALLAGLTRLLSGLLSGLLAGLLAGLTGLLAFLTLIGLLLTIFVFAAHVRLLLAVVDLLHRFLGSTDCATLVVNGSRRARVPKFCEAIGTNSQMTSF